MTRRPSTWAGVGYRWPARIQSAILAANAERALLRGQASAAVLPDLDEVLRTVDSWHAELTAADVAAQRDVLEPLIDRVIPRHVGWRRYVVDVIWSPYGQNLRALADAIGDKNGS